MKTSKPILVVALALAAIAGFGLLWQASRIRTLVAENQRLQPQAEADPLPPPQPGPPVATPAGPSELNRLKTSEDALKIEVARLRSRLASVLREDARTDAAQLAARASAGAESGAGKGILGGMSQMMQGMMDAQFEGRLARMKTSLNLTPEQEQAVRDILRRQATQATQAAQKMLAGDLTADESSQLARSAGDPEAQIKALLTPEQIESYQNYQRSEKVANARLAANGEVLQLQSLFSLTPEQQDQAFAVLYDQTYGLLDNPAANASSDPAAAAGAADPGALLDQMLDRKIRALEGVLTPDQLAQYRRLQEQQMGFIKKLMPQTKTAPGPQ